VNRSQRIVLVIASAALAITIDRAFSASSLEGGWFGYAPNTGADFSPGIEPARQALVRLALLIAWTLISVRLLRDEGEQ
jgi:hypothetical protein